jgi:biotin-dependent carboxylase-like uncharacterized protein
MTEQVGAALRVLNGGVLATVQDRGRHGLQRYGVPRSGAMDQVAYAIANQLLDNPLDAAVLELTAGGALLEVLAPTVLALTGGDLGALLDEEPLPLWMAVFVRAGAQLRLSGRTSDWGARAYLAMAGGIVVPQLLSSRSTYLPGGFGGFDGRPLRNGDLVLGDCANHDPLLLAGRRWPKDQHPCYSATPTLRIMAGPHLELFASDALNILCSHGWQLAGNSNRIGYRLEGPTLPYAVSKQITSLGVLPGVIQLPPDGQPILLMADAQPTGGYPIIGVVLQPDLPLAAQLLPGDQLRFHLVDADEAHASRLDWQCWHEVVLEEDNTIYGLGWIGG